MAITTAIPTYETDEKPNRTTQSHAEFRDAVDKRWAKEETIITAHNQSISEINSTLTEMEAKRAEVAAQAVDGGYSQDALNGGQLDTRYYTETEVDANFGRNLERYNKVLDGSLALKSTVSSLAAATVLWTGNGTSQTGLGNIDLASQWGDDSTEVYGGMVRIKNRADGGTYTNNVSVDTVRGAGRLIFPNLTDAEFYDTNQFTDFNNNGFSLGDGTNTNTNYSGGTYVAHVEQTIYRNSSTWGESNIFTGNGTFDANTAGWNPRDASTALSVVSNAMKIENTGTNYGFAVSDAITGLEENTDYVYELDIVEANVQWGISVHTDPTGIGGTLSGVGSIAAASSTRRTYLGFNTGNNTTVYLRAQVGLPGIGDYLIIDNVQIKKAVNGLTNHGHYWEYISNPFTGFEAVMTVGSGSAGHIAPLHMTANPELIESFNLDGAYDHLVYYGDKDKCLYLNSTGGETNSSAWNNIAPTKDGIELGATEHVNKGGCRIMFYCYHSVEGIRKIGYCTTTASDHYVPTGFRPGYFMSKRINGTGNYFVADVARGVDGTSDAFLHLDSNDAEGTGDAIDFTNDGFVLSQNWGAGELYIYHAKADNGSTIGGGTYYEKPSDTNVLAITDMLLTSFKEVNDNQLLHTQVKLAAQDIVASLTSDKLNHVYYDVEADTWGSNTYGIEVTKDTTPVLAGDIHPYDVLNNETGLIYAVGDNKASTHNTSDLFSDASDIAHYRLNGDGSDNSRNGYDLTLTNVQFVEDELGNTVAYFDGETSVAEIDGTSGPDLGTVYTVAVIFKPEGNSGCPVSWGDYAASSSYERSFPSINDNNIAYQIGYGTGSLTSRVATTDYTKYMMLAIAVNGTTHTIFVNNTLATTIEAPASYDLSNYFSLGAQRNSGNLQNQFKGLIHSCRIFNQSVVAADALLLYDEACRVFTKKQIVYAATVNADNTGQPVNVNMEPYSIKHINNLEVLNELKVGDKIVSKDTIGKVLQVVSNYNTGSGSTTSTTTTASGLSASITPSSVNSRILVLTQENVRALGIIVSTNYYSNLKYSLNRDGSIIVDLDDADSSGAYAFGVNKYDDNTSMQPRGNISLNYVDSPNTTLPVIYTTMIGAGLSGMTAYWGRGHITLIEIGE